MTHSTVDLDQLFIQDVPLIDVRAPVEFNRGAFPGSINLPILDDQERERVGLCYKNDGPEAAQQLGHELVSGTVRDARLAAWISFLDSHPDAALYCFRGGQRSQIAAGWLSKAGKPVRRIEGGYKRLRQHLLDVYEQLPPLIVIAGKTGTGKTEFLSPYRDTAIDLEGLANHRGSAFGGHLDPQPSQISFENALSIEFLKKRHKAPLFLEDEGRLIGRIHVPLPLQEKMKQSPLLLIEESVEKRAGRILNEYIVDQWSDYRHRLGDEAYGHFTDYLLNAVDAIRKRLGNVAHGEIREMMIDALAAQQQGDVSLHRRWIERLLTDYYDPMYEYQLEKKQDRIVARGDHEALRGWINRQH